jgi:hypothetical protein
VVKKSFSKEILSENMKMRALWSEVENHVFCVFKVSIFGENDIFKMCKTRFAPAVLNTFFDEWSINQYFNKNNDY